MYLDRKTQSALEYLMTYGWAILIIVIVAAVLYSLGIFSPSSSIGTTVTGFSGFQTTATCAPNGTMVIQLVNELGYAVNITNLNITYNGNTAPESHMALIDLDAGVYILPPLLRLATVFWEKDTEVPDIVPEEK